MCSPPSVARATRDSSIFPTHRLVTGPAPELNGRLRVTEVTGGAPRRWRASRSCRATRCVRAATCRTGRSSRRAMPGVGPLAALDTAARRPACPRGSRASRPAPPRRSAPLSWRGGRQAAFLVRPPTVEQVEAVALAGETMPQKIDLLLPEADERPALLARSTSDRLARRLPRGRGRRAGGLASLPTRDEREPVVGNGRGGRRDDGRRRGGGAAVVARLEELHAGGHRASRSSRRSSASASFGAGRRPRRGRRPDRREHEREARIPFFSALDRGRRGAGDAGRLLRLRRRLRDRRGVDGARAARARS